VTNSGPEWDGRGRVVAGGTFKYTEEKPAVMVKTWTLKVWVLNDETAFEWYKLETEPVIAEEGDWVKVKLEDKKIQFLKRNVTAISIEDED
jgi:hypothetical protein